MKKLKIFIILILTITNYVFSQTPNIKWDVNYSIEKNNEHKLIVSGEIAENWYVYGMNIPEGGPLPLYLSVENSDEIIESIKFTEISKPKTMYDNVFEMNISSYYPKIEILCKFNLKVETIDTINLIIDGQACNKKDGRCIQIYETIPINLKK